jgi:hypothetical protein
MAKAKKRVATKRGSKRVKLSAKPARKKAAKHTTSKKEKSKIRRGGTSVPKSAVKKKRRSKTAARKVASIAPEQMVELPVETTIIDVIEEPMPGVIVVTEYESVQIATPTLPAGEAERRKDVGPDTESQ